jgi:hypothetical protein
VVNDARSPLAMTIVVPQEDLRRSVEMLHGEFFKHVDGRVFAESPRHAPESSEEPPVGEGKRVGRLVQRWVLARQN